MVVVFVRTNVVKMAVSGALKIHAKETVDARKCYANGQVNAATAEACAVAAVAIAPALLASRASYALREYGRRARARARARRAAARGRSSGPLPSAPLSPSRERYGYLRTLASRAVAAARGEGGGGGGGGWRALEATYEGMQADAAAELARVLALIDPSLPALALRARGDDARASAASATGARARAATPAKAHGEACAAMLENYAEVEAFFRRARERAEAAGSAAAGAEAACLHEMLTSRRVERFDRCIPEAEADDS